MIGLAQSLEIDDVQSIEYILSAIRTPITISDHQIPDEPIVYCNQAFLDMTGYARKEVLGRNCRFLQNEDTKQREVAKIRDALHDERAVRVTLRNYRKSGEQFMNDLIMSPIQNQDSEVTHYIGMQLDVTTIVQQAKFEQQLLEMQEQQKRLQAIARAKDEFIAIASHQLRTPSSAVKQYLGLLLEGHIGTLDDASLEILRKAYNSNERQINIVSELLQTARKDASDYALHKAHENITTIISEVITELQSSIDLLDQTITVSSANKVFARVDRKEFKTAIMCLIENASKYSVKGASIRVAVETSKKRCTIAIADHGVGIHPKDQHKIFEKFTRVNNELSDTVSGSGLGLYWAKRVIEMHGGSITLKSQLKKGSTFTVSIPVEQDD